MRKLLQVTLIVIFMVSTLGATAQAKPQNDTLKTKIVINKKSPKAISAKVKNETATKVVFNKKSVMPLKGQEPKIAKIVPGESNSARTARLAQEAEANRKARIARAARPQPQPVRVVRAASWSGSFDPLYQAAGARFGVPWQVLAAVHSVESGQSGNTTRSSYAGATGPMQFLPSTFRAYAIDGDGDGVASIHSVVDSVYSAANYISANLRTKGTIKGALWQYNHSWSYVSKVLGIARSFGY